MFPEWKLDSEFLTTHFFQARALDAKLSSHPIEVDCPDANMINQVRLSSFSFYFAFNFYCWPRRSSIICRTQRQAQVRSQRFVNGVLRLTYSMLVLRMLASYVGEDRFLKGVSIYLKKHTYKNSVTKDLWEGIQAATGMSAIAILDLSWINPLSN